MQKIPQTDSVRELAEFWDTHDITDFEDQLEEVTPVFGEALVQIRLQPKDIEAVKQAASLKGMNHADLIREWVLEKVHTA